MRTLAAALALVVLVGCAHAEQRGKDDGAVPVGPIWMQLNEDWTPAPPEVAPEERTAPATLLQFGSGHRFSMLHCILIQHGKGTTIARGYGFVILLGQWSVESGAVRARYSQVYESIPAVPRRDVHAVIDSGPVTLEDESLLFNGVAYRRAPVDPRQYEEFVRIGEAQRSKK